LALASEFTNKGEKMAVLSFYDLQYHPSVGELVGFLDFACPGEGVVTDFNGKWIKLTDSISGEERKLPYSKVFPLDQTNV
jgi:hypothetical protein